MFALKQSTAKDWPFFLHDSSGDPVTGKVSGDFTKRIKKEGGAFAAMTVTITELEGGWYTLAMTSSHTDTIGSLVVYLTVTGGKQVNMQWEVTVPGVAGANLTHIDGLATTGNNATLNLKHLNVQNNAGTAVYYASTGGNGHGFLTNGNGSGRGTYSVGGDTGPGIEYLGGATSGDAIKATVNSGKALGDTIVDAILARASITEPSGVPSWPMSLGSYAGWVAALSRNKILQTNTLQTLRNDADNADIATSTQSDDGTTFTRGEWV